MADKFNAYDILGILIPGILLLAWIPTCFPEMATWPPPVNFPDAFSVLALTALAVFLGQLVQALASLAEPVIYWTWGGRPSDRALAEGLKRYFPSDTAARINDKISQALPQGSETHSLFLYAMQQATTAGNSRVEQFNTLYAYHRALLVLAILIGLTLAASMLWGAFYSWSAIQKTVALVLFFLLTLLIWYRAWQRACYYVREVLLTAERVLDGRNTVKE